MESAFLFTSTAFLASSSSLERLGALEICSLQHDPHFIIFFSQDVAFESNEDSISHEICLRLASTRFEGDASSSSDISPRHEPLSLALATHIRSRYSRPSPNPTALHPEPPPLGCSRLHGRIDTALRIALEGVDGG